MDDRRAKAQAYADERAEKLVRNETTTKARILFLYFGGVFFSVVSLWRIAQRPTEIEAYSGLLFVFVCAVAIFTLKKRIERGYELLDQKGELRIPQDEGDNDDGQPSAGSQR